MTDRLLLVEDDPLLRRVLSSLLTRAGYDVVAVEDGAPAIALADDHVFEVVIADFNMRHVGGCDVVRHYKAKFGRRVCCVVLSGADDEHTKAACVSAGVDDLIMKPALPAELRRRLLDARAALEASAA